MTEIEVFYSSTRSPNYVNGQLLRAFDLHTDQNATLSRMGLLGQAVGHGIAEGLWVSSDDPTTLRITNGLGINRKGRVIHLEQEHNIRLEPKPVSVQPISKPIIGGFVDCPEAETGAEPSQTFTAELVDGAYLLTARPTYVLKGSVSVRSIFGTEQDETCAPQWQVDGIAFHVFHLHTFNPQTMAGAAVSGEVERLQITHQRRSQLADWCFSSASLADYFYDPFTHDAAGVKSKLSEWMDSVAAADSPKPTPCHLPLAVFDWQAGAVQFVDNWAVRRRVVTQPNPANKWSPVTSDAREAEGQARFYQFQQQLNELINAMEDAVDSSMNDPVLEDIRAQDYFAWLPPVGFLPVRFNSDQKEEQQWLNQINRWVRFILDDANNEEHLLDLNWLQEKFQLISSARGIHDVNGFFEGYLAATSVGGSIHRDIAHYLLNQSWWHHSIDRMMGDIIIYAEIDTALDEYLKREYLKERQQQLVHTIQTDLGNWLERLRRLGGVAGGFDPAVPLLAQFPLTEIPRPYVVFMRLPLGAGLVDQVRSAVRNDNNG